MTFHVWLQAANKLGASDPHLEVGTPSRTRARRVDAIRRARVRQPAYRSKAAPKPLLPTSQSMKIDLQQIARQIEEGKY